MMRPRRPRWHPHRRPVPGILSAVFREVLVVTVSVMLLGGCGKSSGGSRASAASTVASTPATRPAASPSNGLPQVGALFSGPADGSVHFCTASVVHSPGHDLLVTAAHCVAGTGTNLVFVPDYHDGVSPFGSWSVTAAYVSPRWLANQDPQADLAFLAVASHHQSGQAVNVEDIVGADRLVTAQGFRVQATVVAYPLGMGGKPITCTNETHEQDGYPTFECDGYVDGTSGGPWLTNLDPVTQRGDLYGVIGGLHQGGCTPQVSYSPHFSSEAVATYQRAINGGPGDDVASAASDGC